MTTGVLGAWPMLVSRWEARSPGFCSVLEVSAARRGRSGAGGEGSRAAGSPGNFIMPEITSD